jgi:hypothetical protein
MTTSKSIYYTTPKVQWITLLGPLFKDINALRDLSKLSADKAFKYPVLMQPMTVLLEKYYNGNPLNFNYWGDIANIPCKVQCGLCGEPLKGRWVGKSAVKVSANGTPIYFDSEGCERCRKEYFDSSVAYIRHKWRKFFRDDSWECDEDDEYITAELPVTEQRRLADAYFGGDLQFNEKDWSVSLASDSLIDLILRTRPRMAINDKGELTLDFDRLSFVEADAKEGTALLLSWALSYITEKGKEACPRGFEMSKKFIEELKPLIMEAGYAQLHFAIWRAGKEAVGRGVMDRLPRDVIFKSELKKTLINTLNGTWPLKSGSRYYAERDCPDSFWNIVRLNQHELTINEILDWPLGLLWEAMMESATNSVDEENAADGSPLA